MLGSNREPPGVTSMLEDHMLLLVVHRNQFVFDALGSGASEMHKYCTLGGGNAHTQLLEDPESLRDHAYLLKQVFLRVEHNLKECIVGKPSAMLLAPLGTYFMHYEYRE